MMTQEITQALKKIASEKGIEILYALESGSRAWGFPSVDSDYDIRFIYRQPLDWYMSLQNHKDSIENVGKVLDFGGWELRKTLRLIHASNSSIFEKLQSPIVYDQIDGFREELWKLALQYYRPKAGIHHYLGHAKSFMINALNADMVKLKKYFYAIRCVMAAQWIQAYNEVPPMEFSHLRVMWDDQTLNDWIDEMLVLKSAGDESLLVSRNDVLNKYLNRKIDEGDAYAKAIGRAPETSIEGLNQFFRKWTLNI